MYSKKKLGYAKGGPVKRTAIDKKAPAKKASSSWKSKNHYLKDGTIWDGSQHAMPNGQLHTNKTHTKTSKRQYHFRDLSKTAQVKTKASKVVLTDHSKK